MNELNYESMERPIDKVLDAEYINQLGALGLVDATLYEYDVTPHPEDSQWLLRNRG